MKPVGKHADLQKYYKYDCLKHYHLRLMSSIITQISEYSPLFDQYRNTCYKIPNK